MQSHVRFNKVPEKVPDKYPDTGHSETQAEKLSTRYIQKGVRVNPHALQDETLQRQPQDTNDTVHRAQ